MIRIAMQKSGRISEKSIGLLKACGLEFNWTKNQLLSQATDFPLELMLVRDDDIPEYVRRGVCELGIVGENVLEEFRQDDDECPSIERRLGFGKCRLSLALPNGIDYSGPQDLQGLRIATSYPQILKRFLKKNNVDAQIAVISGSVELLPTLGMADAVCDLVSTGSTLRMNNLREVDVLLKSECLLAKTTRPLSTEKEAIIERLLNRIDGVQRADKNKYIMMNAPRSALAQIHEILPGMDHPSIMQLDGTEDIVAVHAVCQESIFWETMEKLKAVGATSVLVVPIEKIL
jgi:ATP phosphoribosyltransferase